MAFDAYHKWLGIRPADQPPNHYRLLAIGLFEDDPDVIETAADQRMNHVRTFQIGQHSALSQMLMTELSAARLCLLNAEKKATYDAALRAGLDAANRAQPTLPPARPLTAPVRPLTPAPQAPDLLAVIVTDASAGRRSARKHRSSVGPVASAWLALAIMAIPTAIFVGYLIWARLESRRQTTLAARPSGRAAVATKMSNATPPARQPLQPRAPSTGGSRPGVRPTDNEPPRGNAPIAADLSGKSTMPTGPESDSADAKKPPRGSDAPVELARNTTVGAAPPASPSPAPQPAIAPAAQPTESPPEPRSSAEPAKVKKATAAAGKPRGKRRPARPSTGRNKRSPKQAVVVKTEPLGLRWQAAFASTKMLLPTIGVRPNLAPLTLKGRPTPNGLFAPPPDNGYSTISYALGKKAKSLTFEVGIDDASINSLATQPWFQVLGDDKEIWKSPPIRGKGHMEKCENLNVESVNLLELRVNCPGKRDGSGTVWFEPMVTWK